jgi:hypothetical protein
MTTLTFMTAFRTDRRWKEADETIRTRKATPYKSTRIEVSAMFCCEQSPRRRSCPHCAFHPSDPSSNQFLLIATRLR